MNPLTPLELLDIIEREHGFESPSIRLALERAEKVEELNLLYHVYFKQYKAMTKEWKTKYQLRIKELQEVLK